MNYKELNIKVKEKTIKKALKREGYELTEENIEEILNELQTSLECEVSGLLEDIVGFRLED